MSHRAGPLLLLNPRRFEIVLSAAAYPGVHLRSVSRLLLQPLPTLRFHVAALKAARLLESRPFFGRLSLFVRDLYPKPAEPLLVAWEDPQLRDILRRLPTESSASIPDLARELGISAASVRSGANRLRSVGAIRWIRSGERIERSHRWHQFEVLCRSGRHSRAENIDALFREENLHPKVAEIGEGTYRFEVDGPRFRMRFTLPLDPLLRT